VYSAAFYDAIQADAVRSAQVVVPRLLDLVRPRSVVDVGCGTGAWLAEFERSDVDDVLGIDGPWVDPSRLLVGPRRFLSMDLTERFELHRTFDLAVSLETAEHLDAGSADRFVENLARLADTVLFSAAAPGQGGSDHHNEQWPSYWVDRFAGHGFVAVDCIRWEHWDDARVAAHYRQNAFVAVRDTALEHWRALAAWSERHPDRVGALPAVVHPATRLARADTLEDAYPFRVLAMAASRRARAAVRARFGRLGDRGGGSSTDAGTAPL
jgi:SAM-dependent methyltransferase